MTTRKRPAGGPGAGRTHRPDWGGPGPHAPRLRADLCDRRPAGRSAAAHHREDPRARGREHHHGIRRDLPRGRHLAPPGLHRPSSAAPTQRGIPRPHAGEWDEFITHFELRKVALGVCTRDYGTACVHEHACVRCPALRPDPDQQDRMEEIIVNLQARLDEAHARGWRGEVTGLEATLAAAEGKVKTMQDLAQRHGRTHLGMPRFGSSIGRQI